MSKPEARPVVKQWIWMTPDEQVEHLMQTHGFRDDYFTHEDETPWTDAETKAYFEEEPDSRNDYHDQDHLDYRYGGGTEHTHSLTHPSEVDAAIASIKEAISARQ